MDRGGRLWSGWTVAGGRWSPFALLALAVLLRAAPASAQPTSDPARAVAEVEAAYEALDYEAADSLARAALARPDRFTPDQIVRLHTTRGLLLYAEGDALAAADQFRRALFLDPTLALDPVLVSPVTVEFFNTTKQAFLREREGTPGAGGAVPYVVLQDQRPATALRSLALPGWGQLARGERTKGWVLAGAWAVAVGGTVYAHVAREGAQRDYDRATTQAEIDARYSTLNRWHHTRSALLVGTGVVYGAALLDALLTGAPRAPGAGSPSRLQVAPAGAGLRLQVRL